jgi:hypothetical protein
MKTLSWSAGIALLALAVCGSTAGAETTKCQRTIAKANSQFVQAQVKALTKCEESIVKGKISGPCPDSKATTSLQKATDKLTSSIDKSCGGDDKVCGGNLTGEDTPASLGWPTNCPDFEHRSNSDPACNAALNDCGDIASCLSCIGSTAAEQAAELYYDELILPSTSDKALNKCQTTIGKATAAFFNSKTKALQKCWDAKLNGKHSNSCVPPAMGDEKYLAAIDKAETKKIDSINKACTGVTFASIGFATDCPAVTIPDGAPCGGPVTNLAQLIACVDCVTEFKADCVDRVQVPQFTPYPSECNVCTEPAPTGPCPTTIEFTADGLNVDLDTGFTGLAHDATVPTNGRVTLAVSGCAGGPQPNCGQCNVNGPLDNAGGIAFANHRCQDQPWVQCSTDGDCITQGALGPCLYFFGAPLPLRAGGVSTCVINEINGTVSGTINFNDGTSTLNVPLSSKVHPTGTEFAPCPHCTAGLCEDGPRVGQACAVNGTGIFGDVSLDCPPNPGSLAGTLGITLNMATGVQTRTVSATNPTCTETGFNGKKCLCNTCNNVNEEACSTNADCPISGGNPGICGGKRCLSGTNAGAPCILESECPGGNCNRPGQATKPNSCNDNTATPMIDGTLCVDIGGNEGECPDGPVDQVCSVQKFRSCGTDAECAPSVTCPDCLPNQTCIARNRPCFPDNGVIGNSLTVAGVADPPCGGTAKPVVGSFFCVAPVAASAVNSAGGLPAVGRVRLPGTVIIDP